MCGQLEVCPANSTHIPLPPPPAQGIQPRKFQGLSRELHPFASAHGSGSTPPKCPPEKGWQLIEEVGHRLSQGGPCPVQLICPYPRLLSLAGDLPSLSALGPRRGGRQSRSQDVLENLAWASSESIPQALCGHGLAPRPPSPLSQQWLKWSPSSRRHLREPAL